MSIIASDISITYTAATAASAQSTPALSIGGYASTTSLYPNTTLASPVGAFSTTLTVSAYASISGSTVLAIDEELIIVTAVNSNTVAVVERGAFGTLSLPHSTNTTVSSVGFTSLFGNALGPSLTQYRCLAVTNTNTTYAANNVAIYFKYNDLSPSSTYTIAIERPSNDATTGAVTSAGTFLSFRDSSLSGMYADNAFAGAVLKVTSGNNINQTRVIASYDAPSKTIVFASSMPLVMSIGDTYTVAPGPSQRILNENTSPIFSSSSVTSLLAARNQTSAVTLGVLAGVDGGALKPNDTLYLWIKRTLTKNAPVFDNNGMVLAVRFTQ